MRACSNRLRSEERRVGKECRSRWWPYQAEDGIRDLTVTGVQTCALPISKWAYRDPRTHALEPVYSVHYNDYAAKLQGAQIAYDVGIQRTCWQIHSLTNWMGDAGVLKSIKIGRASCRERV